VETLPWYKSAIIRQQIVQLLIAGTAFFGITSTDIDWDATVGAIFAGVAGITAVWTIITRIFKPAPNMSSTAAVKEQDLVRKGEIPNPNSVRGFVLAQFLNALLFAASCGVIAFTLHGCTGTRAAYSEADSLPDRAYVALEQYFAVLREWKGIVTSPTTPEDVKEALKAAELKATPVFLGDPEATPPRPSIRKVASLYEATQNAQNATELQTAVNDAVRALTDFSNAVKAARGKT
jgi:hypothetical protein